MASYKYVLKVDGEVAYEGQDPREKYEELKRTNPNARVSITWVRLDDEDLLIIPVA